MLIARFFTIQITLIRIFSTHRKIARGEITREQFGKYLRKQLEGLGPTFIKIGQILSLRPDLIPIEYCMALRGLLDRTEEMPITDTMLILRKELGKDPSKVFSHISKTPIATASIAQVYKGRIKGTNDIVAIKIKKTGVEKLIKTDIRILKLLNTLFYPLIQKHINTRSLISDLDMVLDKEMNFVKEGTNVERFKEVFKDVKFVKTPKIYWDYTSRNLLVMEFIPGISLSKVFTKIDHDPTLHEASTITIDDITINKKDLAHKLIQVTAHSVFNAGFFHADPHPANIILTYDNKIAFIDFGMVGDLLNNEKLLFRELVYCISTRDEEKILELLTAYNVSLGYPQPAGEVLTHLKHYLHDLISDFVSADQKTFPITKFMYNLGGMSFKFNFPPPPFIMLISKQIFTLEGLAAYLIPDLNIVEEFKPYIYSYRTKDSLKKFSNEKVLKLLDDSSTLGMMLPESLTTILEKLSNEGMTKMPTMRAKLPKPLLILLFAYGIFMGIVLSISFAKNTALIILLWGSIIMIVFSLYIIFF